MTNPYYLSVVASKGPFRFNESPKIVNLPTTIKVMENTPPDTYLFKLLFTDENPADTFTVTDTINASHVLKDYIKFNTTSYVVSTGTKPIDYETSTAGEFEIIISDGTGTTQFFTVTGTVTIQYVDVNEDGISLVLNSNATAEFNEDKAPGSVIYSSVVDKSATLNTSIDKNEVIDYWMNCGKDSKYFSFDPIANEVKLVREYDMDKGLSGTATCNITARDTGGFTDTKSFTLTVNQTNDIAPEFPHKNYVFFQRPSDTFFTLIANMSGSDADVVDTPTVLTYRFGPASSKASTESHFQIDEDGILYIRNVSTVPDGSYKTFEIIVSDNDATAPLEGTCTVTVIFSGVATTTTTTTERYYVFLDDHENYWWMFLLGALVFAAVVIIIFIACNDPRIYDYVVYQMNRFAHWCRRKPKPKAPRRTVGKLTVTVNNKRLENDPDNALPWELLAKDGDVPELNQVQADIQKRKEKRDRDYKNFKGLPIFEKGKGPRPDSAQSTSSISSDVTRTSESPKYATFVSKDDNLDEGGEGQWGNLEGATGGK
ncbi:uncharacterized protein LOC127835304 [Dreissena polymorpha]|nr:uncharacterized protein LOC127835304 [Dreissena polymorpha]